MIFSMILQISSINSFVRVNVPKVELTSTTVSPTIELTSPLTTSPFTTLTTSLTTLKPVGTETVKPTLNVTQSTTKSPTVTTTVSSINSTLIKASNQTNSTVMNTTNNTSNSMKIDRNLYPNYFCKCDLLVYDCDINCCCDIDCTKEMIEVMDCSKSLTDLDQYDYDGREDGLPSCAVSSSLFCVLEEHDEKVVRVSYMYVKYTMIYIQIPQVHKYIYNYFSFNFEIK